MNVLFVTHEIGATGVGRLVVDFASYLKNKKGHNVGVLTHDGADDGLVFQLEEAGVPVYLGKVLEPFDVVVVASAINFGSVCDFGRSFPIMWWVMEGIGFVQGIDDYSKVGEAFMLAKEIVYLSNYQKDEIFRFWRKAHGHKMNVIPGAVDNPVEGQPLKTREISGTAKIVCVGSVYPRKRPEDLILACDSLKGEVLEVVFIGDRSPLASEIQEIVDRQPERYRFTGALYGEELHREIASADIFCLPSGDETQGLAPIEAAFHGVPVLLSDIAAFREYWQHGTNCLMHPVRDPRLLAWNITILLKDRVLRNKLAEEGLKNAMRFSSDLHFARMELLLQAMTVSKI